MESKACCSTHLNVCLLNNNNDLKNPSRSIRYGFRPVLCSNSTGNKPSDRIGFRDWRSCRNRVTSSVRAEASICVSRSRRWWEDKAVKPNMVEIQSAQQLVDTLRAAGDRLVIIDFYSPGCGSCRTLHPKICQIAESNPNAMFLKVNFEQMKTMCECLNIHVLPFFRFYRGSNGRLCNFSCTNSTIKKFKNEIAKHSTDGCSIGPAKGLEESEILRLVASGLIPAAAAAEDSIVWSGENELISQVGIGKQLLAPLLL